VSYYLALRKAGVPAEMHIFKDGRHGSGPRHDRPGALGMAEAARELDAGQRVLKYDDRHPCLRAHMSVR
jgi:hypothetical protein